MEEITILKNIPNQSIVLYIGNVYYICYENQYNYFIEVKLLYKKNNSKTIKAYSHYLGINNFPILKIHQEFQNIDKPTISQSIVYRQFKKHEIIDIRSSQINTNCTLYEELSGTGYIRKKDSINNKEKYDNQQNILNNEIYDLLNSIKIDSNFLFCKSIKLIYGNIHFFIPMSEFIRYFICRHAKITDYLFSETFNGLYFEDISNINKEGILELYTKGKLGEHEAKFVISKIFIDKNLKAVINSRNNLNKNHSKFNPVLQGFPEYITELNVMGHLFRYKEKEIFIVLRICTYKQQLPYNKIEFIPEEDHRSIKNRENLKDINKQSNQQQVINQAEIENVNNEWTTDNRCINNLSVDTDENYEDPDDIIKCLKKEKTEQEFNYSDPKPIQPINNNKGSDSCVSGQDAIKTKLIELFSNDEKLKWIEEILYQLNQQYDIQSNRIHVSQFGMIYELKNNNYEYFYFYFITTTKITTTTKIRRLVLFLHSKNLKISNKEFEIIDSYISNSPIHNLDTAFKQCNNLYEAHGFNYKRRKNSKSLDRSNLLDNQEILLSEKEYFINKVIEHLKKEILEKYIKQ